MACRHFYSFVAGFRGVCDLYPQSFENAKTACQDLRYLATVTTNYLWTICTVMGSKYVTLATIFVVVALSFLLPDVSQKYHISKEVKAMKEVLSSLNKEVIRAEAACLTVADEVCVLQSAVQDNATETEIAIMSYVYTDSFDAKKPLNKTANMFDI